MIGKTDTVNFHELDKHFFLVVHSLEFNEKNTYDFSLILKIFLRLNEYSILKFSLSISVHISFQNLLYLYV